MSQDNQNDIDQILNEVEQLRRELHSQSEALSTSLPEDVPQGAATVDSAAISAAKAAAELFASAETSEATPSSTPAEVPAPVEAQAQVEAQPASESSPVSDSEPTIETFDTEELMKEFQASIQPSEPLGADEGMESTLSELKEDLSVKTLLDETLDDQARRQSGREFEDDQARRQSDRVQETPAQEPILMKNEKPTMSPVSTSASFEEGAPSLTMSLTGSMTLKLKYEFAGQEVIVGFTDEFLKVELADGTEFKIPVGRQKTLRRVA